MPNETVILAPNGQLGYGIPKTSTDIARERFDIDVIAIDAGSVDQGPFYLGHGEAHTNDDVVRRDLKIVLEAAHEEDVPLLIGTLGSAGSRVHVDNAAEIGAEVIDSRGFDPEVARIYTDVSPDVVNEKIEFGEVRQIDYDHELTRSDVKNSERIVAQIGPEPFVEAVESGADVVFAGRSLDTSPFAAIPLAEGKDPGLVYHFAKIMECGSQATTSGSGNDSLVGIVAEDYFEVEPPNPDLRCTTESVAAHTLYEKSDPYEIATTDGHADVSKAEFEQVSDRRVRVTGTEFEPAETPGVKLEGVERTGYRTISIGGARDPTLVSNLEYVLGEVRETVDERVEFDSEDYLLQFRQYGRDGVQLSDTASQVDPMEVGVVIDVVGRTQQMTDTVCALARATLLHQDFEGRVAIGGNIAFPYSPSDIQMGPVYQFSVYHVVENVRSTDIADMRWGAHP